MYGRFTNFCLPLALSKEAKRREVCDTREVGRKRALEGGSQAHGKVGEDEWVFEVIESGRGAGRDGGRGGGGAGGGAGAGEAGGAGKA